MTYPDNACKTIPITVCATYEISENKNFKKISCVRLNLSANCFAEMLLNINGIPCELNELDFRKTA